MSILSQLGNHQSGEASQRNPTLSVSKWPMRAADLFLQYQDRGRVPEVRRQVVDMAINGSGIRDTARVLRISPTTVIAVIKKTAVLQHVNPTLQPPRRSHAVRVQLPRAAEVDEMGSFVGAKARARWLWHAIAHHTGRVLAYVVGTRKDTVFLKLKALL